MMKSITRKELEKIIIESQYGDLDFYAYCNTPWHAIGIQTFINHELSPSKDTVKGIIFLANSPGKKSIVSPENFILNDNVEVIYFKNVDSRVNKRTKIKQILTVLFSKRANLNNKPPFYMLRPFTIDYMFGATYQLTTHRRCVLVAIDEGIGSYKTKKEIFTEKLFEDSKLRASIGYCIDRCLDYIQQRKYQFQINWYYLFKYEGYSLTLNRKIEGLYRETIQRIAHRENIQDKNMYPNKYVVFLTEPYDLEYQKLAKAPIVDMYSKLNTEFSIRGVKVFVKPHPREDMSVLEAYKKSGFEIMSGSKPLETYLEMLPIKPLALFGTLGTALVTAAAINRLPSYSIVELIEENKLNKEYIKAVDNYKRRYSNFVFFPKEITDFIHKFE